ncbi:Protein N-acetyltransferase, RimJ/RimL family [Amycolatopsis marina]|uniref:Protein N-acetyltransferase, RimJ/RimL family n=1 Tax=Amycolatopsis marina TaxID=490629 RepID=A0A1I0Z8S9_9PSEU|nr:GNAT family N-acetyltransferase [Amycolatopsis marina]SFB22024.1 Protein N-acetyltransferase, RimJ/RimL family [Amycolatopsis marina]
MTSVPELRGARVRLRGLRAEDTDAVLRVFANPETSRHFDADLADPEQARAMLGRGLAYRGPAGTGHWVIEFDGTVVGIAYLRPSEELPGGVAEIGWYLGSDSKSGYSPMACGCPQISPAVGSHDHPPGDPVCRLVHNPPQPRHSGRGLATEAAAVLLEYGLHALGLPAVWALIHEDNTASLALADRLGFADIGSGAHYGGTHRVRVALAPARPAGLHHVELWVADLPATERSLGWLLGELGWRENTRWRDGVSWRLGDVYIVAECSPAIIPGEHERRRPGLNHLALHARSRADVDSLVSAAPDHGWSLMFAELHPHAGGPEHYAAFLEDEQGFEVEVVAPPVRRRVSA